MSPDDGHEHGPRVLLYAGDVAGTGPLRRCAAIAAALVERHAAARALLVAGGPLDGPHALPERTEALALPALRRPEDHGRALDPSEAHGLRAEILRAAVDAFAPAVVVVDGPPLGPGSELLPALSGLVLRRRSRVVLVAGTPSARELAGPRGRSLVPAVAGLYDAVLAYDGGAAARLARAGLRLPVHSVGAMARARPAPPPPDLPARYLLAMVDRGPDAVPLLRALLPALAALRPDLPLVVAAPGLAASRGRALLARMAAGLDLRVTGLRPDLTRVLGAAHAVVAMSAEVRAEELAALGRPALLVPGRGEHGLFGTGPREVGTAERLGVLYRGPLEPGALGRALRPLVADAPRRPAARGEADGAWAAAERVLELAGSPAAAVGALSFGAS